MMSSDSSIQFNHRTRLIILVLSVLCLTAIQSNSLALNFTVICMNDVIQQQTNNDTTGEHWLSSPYHINLLFSAIAVGSLIGTLPLMFCMQKYGIRMTLTVYGLTSALGTLLLPLAVSISYPLVVLCRVLQGVALSISFSAMGAISSRWSVTKEAGTYIAILSCHLQFASVFTMPTAGALCESSLGWRYLYYLQGGITAIFIAAFFYFYRDSPHMHRNVSGKELKRIEEGKGDISTTEGVPYWTITKDPCTLAVWISCFGGNCAFITFLFYGPMYLNKVLHLDVQSTGFATALPYILSALLKFVAGPLSDYSTCVSEKIRIIFFASISQGAMAICYFILATTDSALLGQVCYTAAIVFSGLNVVGVVKCVQLVARQYVHFVMAVMSFCVCIITLVLPMVVTLICPDNTPEQWSRLFIGISVIVVLTNIPFVILARSEAAPWTVKGFRKTSDDSLESSPQNNVIYPESLKDPSSQVKVY